MVSAELTDAVIVISGSNLIGLFVAYSKIVERIAKLEGAIGHLQQTDTEIKDKIKTLEGH